MKIMEVILLFEICVEINFVQLQQKRGKKLIVQEMVDKRIHTQKIEPNKEHKG